MMGKSARSHQRAENRKRPARSEPPAFTAPGFGRKEWILATLLGIATLVVFFPAGQFEFVNYDDYHYVVENPHVATGLNLKNASWAFTAFAAGNWHPLTWISHMVDCQIFGLNPRGHHLTSVFLHAVNSVLLLLVLLGLTGRFWASCIVAALFAFHPLNVESVAWVAERKNVLSGFFWLLTLWAYGRYVRALGDENRSSRTNRQSSIVKRQFPWSRYLMVAALLSLGLLSKPMVVTLPFALLLLDLWPLGRLELGERGWLRRGAWFLMEKAPLLALSALSSFLTILAQSAGGAVTRLEEIPLDERLLNAIVSYARYLFKMVWPFPLAVFYPHPGAALAVSEVLFALLIVLGISGLVLWKGRRHPYLLTGWLWYLGTLVPVIGLVQVGNQAMADRYAYIPLIGPFIMIAWSLEEFGARPAAKELYRRGLAAATAGALAALVLVTRGQLMHWRSSMTLFEYTRAVTAHNYVAYTNIGIALNNKQRWAEAIENFRQAIRIRPRHANALSELGVALAKTDMRQEAIQNFTRAIEVYPTAITHTNLGLAYLHEGQLDQAVEQFRKALRLDGAYLEARLHLARTLSRQGEREEARKHFREAIRIDPARVEARIALGTLLAQEGNWTEAIEQLSAAVEQNPQSADARNNLGAVLLQKGDLARAIEELTRTVEINPNHADAHSNLGVALLQQRNFSGALRHLQTALKLKPDHENARKYLRMAQAQQ